MPTYDVVLRAIANAKVLLVEASDPAEAYRQALGRVHHDLGEAIDNGDRWPGSHINCIEYGEEVNGGLVLIHGDETCEEDTWVAADGQTIVNKGECMTCGRANGERRAQGPMSLDAAIQHAERVSEQQVGQRSAAHKQLAGWLTELQLLRGKG